MLKVSIIIPNYNHQNFLIQRIESVLNQTFQDFELILLDDASTDKSQEIIQQYANHPKVTHVVLNSENSGSVFRQWIKGIELSCGDFIWIAESDDYADHTFLDQTMQQITSKENLGMVFTDTHKVDANGKTLGLVSDSKVALGDLQNEGGVLNKLNLSKYLLKSMVVVNASSVVFKKEVFNSVNYETLKEFKNTGDVFVYIGVALKYDVYFLPTPLNFMRLHQNNTTKKNKNSGLIYRDKILILDYYLNDFNEASVNKQDIIGFLLGFLLLSIDYGYLKQLNKLLDKMNDSKLFDRKKFLIIKCVIVFYNYFMFRGRPFFIRERLKKILEI